jgi:hypothetical protein
MESIKVNNCKGEDVNCLDSSCEDFEPECALSFCTDYVNIISMTPEYTGEYMSLRYLEGNRLVYKMNGKCIWWHRQYRHWWVGPCENVGLNSGYAYIDEDTNSPWFGTWRRGGSDEIIQNVIIEGYSVAPSGGDTTHQSSGTAGVNAIIRNGRYKQTCRPVYKNGRLRCPVNHSPLMTDKIL